MSSTILMRIDNIDNEYRKSNYYRTIQYGIRFLWSGYDDLSPIFNEILNMILPCYVFRYILTLYLVLYFKVFRYWVTNFIFCNFFFGFDVLNELIMEYFYYFINLSTDWVQVTNLINLEISKSTVRDRHSKEKYRHFTCKYYRKNSIDTTKSEVIDIFRHFLTVARCTA